MRWRYATGFSTLAPTIPQGEIHIERFRKSPTVWVKLVQSTSYINSQNAHQWKPAVSQAF
jgi:hypothetical protein